MTEQNSKLPLFPLDSGANDWGHLVTGGCDTVDLAAEFGTPLYLFDENTPGDRRAELITSCLIDSCRELDLGPPRLIRRRETIDDPARCDVV